MYTLYAVDDWASLCVHLALEEMGQPFERRLMDQGAGAMDTPVFREISPFGLIPALDTPEGPIFETGAILLWLSERHGLAPAPLSRERAAFLKWFVFVNTTVHATVIHLLHPHRLGGDAAATAVADGAHARLQTQLAAIDAMIVLHRPVWLSGAEPSVLGLYLGMLVRWAVAFPAYPAHALDLGAMPALKSVLMALESRPAVRKVAMAEGLRGDLFTAPA